MVSKTDILRWKKMKKNPLFFDIESTDFGLFEDLTLGLSTKYNNFFEINYYVQKIGGLRSQWN